MCRLFGLHAGAVPVDATFWLVDAPDSLSAQSHRNSDGFGIGTFAPNGTPVVDKAPIAAWQDAEFATAAHELSGSTFVAHVRKASTGDLTDVNTHPFVQDGRLFAHNGVVQGLDTLDARLAELGVADLVHGQTDSERVFALITAEIRGRSGDVREGIERAITWIGEQLPLYSLNFVLTTPTDVWALRYPATNDLFLLERPAGGSGENQPLEARGSRMKAHSERLADRPSLIVASEKMDADPAWREVGSGQLVHVGTDLSVDISTPFRSAPAHLIPLADLDDAAASSQRPAT